MSRFSTFCLHDLKTLTAALSMVAQNAQTHGKDPVFQESAMSRLHGAEGIHVADSAVFRCLPAASPTLTIMANANRIGCAVLESLRHRELVSVGT